MSLPADLTAALDAALPDHPYIAAAAAGVTGLVVVGSWWWGSNPDPRPVALPTMTTPAALRRRRAEQSALTVVLSEGAARPRSGRDGKTTAEVLDIPLHVMPRDAHGKTPYDLIGPDGIRTAVDQFYGRVLADPELGAFFAAVDVTSLKAHQAAFLAQLWGGPVVYPLAKLAKFHQHLGITSAQYWRTVGHLMSTLTAVGIPDWVAVFTMTRLYQARDLIIAQPKPAKKTTEA